MFPCTGRIYAASERCVLFRERKDRIYLRTLHRTCHSGMVYLLDEPSRVPEIYKAGLAILI